MKILLVNDYGTPTGGAEVLTLSLREELHKRGHDVRVFTSCARATATDSYSDYECFGTMSRFRILLQSANPWAFWRLRQILADFQPDVVHVGMFLTQLSPLILPVLRNTPCLYHIHWYRCICPLGTKWLPEGRSCRMPAGLACYRHGCLSLHDWAPIMIQMGLWRRWNRVFDVFVTNSHALKQRLQSEGVPSPIEVVWNGVPVGPPRPSLTSYPTVVFASRLVREKGCDVLVQAFAQIVGQLPDARLYIVGEGPEYTRLKRLITELQLTSHIVMPGYMSRSEMESRFAEAWVQVVPSRWEEPFGLVAAEAMMRGTAVVASATGGLREIVQDGHTGFLVPPDNRDALAAALLTVLRNRDLAERLGRNGRETAVQDFSITTVADKFERLYYRLCHHETVTEVC